MKIFEAIKKYIDYKFSYMSRPDRKHIAKCYYNYFVKNRKEK